MLCGGRLSEGRTDSESLRGVGELQRLPSFSGEPERSRMKSLLVCGVKGRFSFSGDRLPPSKKLLKSRTFPVCRDCIRLCAAPFINDLSGEVSIRFGIAFVTYALSRAFSVSAACADCIALEVLGLEEDMGDEGFIGRGGGARSGSELSHMGTIALSEVEVEW